MNSLGGFRELQQSVNAMKTIGYSNLLISECLYYLPILYFEYSCGKAGHRKRGEIGSDVTQGAGGEF